MQSGLTQEQEAYREALRGWLAGTAPPEAVRKWLDDGDAVASQSCARRGSTSTLPEPAALAAAGLLLFALA